MDLKINFSHRSSSAKNIFYSQKKNPNLKIMKEFRKVNSLCQTNTSGKQPIIIYKKEIVSHITKSLLKTSTDSNPNKNQFISDGGLQKKLDKYYYSTNYSQHTINSHSIPNRKYLTKSAKIEKSKKIFPKSKKINLKEKEKEKEKEKIFSQTVVGGFHRPNLKKHREKQNHIEIIEKNKENKKLRKNKSNVTTGSKNISESLMIDTENKKLERMNKLVENAIVYEMRKSQYETEKKQISLKDKINFKKKGYLEHNGIETSWTIEEDLQEFENNNKEENKPKIETNPDDKEKEKDKDNININKEKEEFKNKLNKKTKSESISNSHTMIINPSKTYNINNINNNNITNLIKSNEDPETNLTLDNNTIKHHKRILKPKVNQFEFLQKIQEEQKKLPMRFNNSSSHNICQSQSLPIDNRKVNDSFRHKSNIKPNSIEIKKNNNSIYDIKELKDYQYKQKNRTMEMDIKEDFSNDEFPFAKKKNQRSLEELAEFTRKKKMKEKQEEEKKEYKKKKKLFEIFKNLSNLKESYSNYNYNYNNNISININSLTGINKNNSTITKRRNKNKKKHKEVNAYYVGTESSKSSSTVLDLNEYYLNILESQQLVVNSKLNKINNYYYQYEENNKNNSEIINYNNVKINNYINGDLLNEKVNDTIKRANKLLYQNYSRNESQDDFISILENKEIKPNPKRNTKNPKKKEKKIDEINIDNINNESSNINLNMNNKNKLNEINTSSENRNTKEKDLPSLPHTFSNANNSNSNSNQNRKLQVDVDIQPCNVLNLVEVIRLIYQRKYFYYLCQLFISQSFSQRYIIAISYFVAICKQYPFKVLEDYCNYKTYYYAFRQLFRPFTRKYFKIFLINCISITKIGYFVESLSRMFKFKSMEKIYIYSQIKDKEDQLKKICGVVIKILLPLIKVHLKNNFQNFVKYYKNKKNNGNKNLNKKINNNKLLNIELNTLDLASIEEKRRNRTTIVNSLNYESLESKSYSLHPNSVDNDTLHQYNNEKNDDKKNNKNRKNNGNKNVKNKISFSEENSEIDINKNKNNLECPKMSKHTKINFLNPSELNDIKNNKNETPSNLNEQKDKDNRDNNTINNSEKKEKEKEKIKIEKIKIIKKNEINGKENEIELDISAEKDNLNNKIAWEYNVSSPNTNLNEGKILENKINKKEEKEKEKKIKEKKEKNDEDEDENDIFDLEELIIQQDKPKTNKKEEKKQKINIKKKEKLEINADIIEEIKESKESKEIQKNNNINKDNNNENIPQKKQKTKSDFFREFPEKLIEQITSEIITEILYKEIKNQEKPIIPKKSFKYENYDLNFSNNLLNSSNSFNFRENISRDSYQFSQSNSQNNSFQYKDNNYPNFFLNESMLASVSANSIFNRTIKDKKKYKSLILYKKKVFPIMIKFIREEIYKKYDRIYDNISIPLKNDFEKIVVGLELQNGKMIKDSYKQIIYKEEINDIIDKKFLLKKIENINKEIRNKDNIFDDNYYDKILNECLIDATIELIKGQRLYKNDGEPLPYGGRNKELIFKYEKNKPKKLVNYITQQLYNLFNTKIGLISTNYDFLTQEQLNTEKEIRLINTLKNELKENEEHWENLEIEETQLKLEITEIISDQLYNEVMEILEHIALSRKKPELYQDKSIFACEEIPKLVFQQTSSENNKKFQTNEEDLINVE